MTDAADWRVVAVAPRVIVALFASCLVIVIGTSYPLPEWPFSIAVLAYAALLWRRPGAFLVVLPIVLPAFDLGMWTGWVSVGESDVAVLLTLAVLLIRAPPPGSGWWPSGRTGIALLFFAGIFTLCTLIGLMSPLGETGQSSNPYLRPDNALRLAKALAEALALLPFIHARQRRFADAGRLLAYGMAGGLIAVTLEVLAERMLFAGVFDFHTDYRVAALFSSMHVGGGHIGAYLALALPFAVTLFPSARARPLAVLAGAGGAYSLVVTFARTGYAAGVIGCALTGLLLFVGRRGGRAQWLVTVVPVATVLLVVALAASSGVMWRRVSDVAADLPTREANWAAGWAARDTGVLADIFGMGLGTYQRAMLLRSKVNRPTDFGIGSDAGGKFVWIEPHTPFFLGQKIGLAASGGLHLTLRYRGEVPGAVLAWSLCDKVLLYSDNCKLGRTEPTAATAAWQTLSTSLSTASLGRSALFGLLRRLVEFSLFDPALDTSIAIRDVRLTDDAGHDVLSNGDFRHGLNRWLFTDDSHVSWRMLNQYLMLAFETGFAGLVAYLTMAGLAISGGVRAALRGNPVGAAVAGSLVSFFVSGAFDNVLEAPRVATLFYLVCLAGLSLWEKSDPLPASTKGLPADPPGA